jgi:hypothetical protein
MGMQGLSIGGMAEQDIAGFIAAKKTTDAQLEGIKNAETAVTGAYNTATGYQQPYATGGQQDYSTLRQMVGDNAFATSVPGQYQSGEQQPGYTTPNFNFQEDPGYQFRQQEGQNAIQNSAAARGMGLSGATMKAMATYGSNLASQEYNNAYNRYLANNDQQRALYGMKLGQYNTNRGFGAGQQQQQYENQYQQNMARYGMRSNLAGYGTEAANNLSTLSTLYGNTRANLALGRGNAISNGYQAAANAAIGQGQHLQEIGSGNLGGNSGGGGSGGNGSGSFDFSSLGGMGGSGGSTSNMAMEGGYA